MSAKRRIDPRSMMEKAVEVMRQSIAEHRGDGSPSPVVGAVLVRTNGSFETAARGELREGNHAEFTLLERKCIGEKLDGSVLYTTLEPCLDRNSPKRGCARHIVNARIKEVYVGIEDDNPKVAGKGIEYLKRHGVKVHMFERDLQDVILEENKVFFEWARQQPEKKEEKPIQLSKYEDPIASIGFEDFSPQALARYRAKASLKPRAGSGEFMRLLEQQGLMARKNGKHVPTGFGLLLFGKDPRNVVPQAGVLARANFPDGTSSRKEFSQGMVLIPDQLEEWLNKVLPSTLDRSSMQRRERVNLPFEMIREAVVNALIHRDYSLEGQKCQLVVDVDKIVIKSPGGPVSPITMDQMRSFSAPMKSRNPFLHFVFARMGMAEEQGFGLSSLKKQAEESGLPLPSYSMEGDFLVLTIYRNVGAAVATLPSKIREALNDDEVASWSFISGKQSVKSADVMNQLGFDERKAQRVLRKLESMGLLHRLGKGPSTHFEVVP